ncbi:glycosyl transferase family 4 [archaeon]|jgi:UDP-N-acetylglucosamine--dolichyl-phosphate N-acetylglucosaminephosphotransferase|nr:glycosyl transferase family 4 [archaeon]MBT7128935.1 glycosyl transferase family 4 [archaeon]
MEYVLLVSVLISFVLAISSLPMWIRVCRRIGLVWEDMNKFGHPKNVASSGGVIVIMAFVLGVLSYVALKTFLFGGQIKALEIFALLAVILMLGIIGLVDDLLGRGSVGNRSDGKYGLPKKARLLLAVAASVPLVVINAGTHFMSLPFFGLIDFGILYPLFLIPLAIVGASTTYNFLAGYNGLEAGQGILILGFLSFVSYVTGSAWLGIVGLCMVGALLGFWIFNKVPASVFPGDMLTYGVGAMIASMAILGNFEKIAFVVFIPYILEVILKSRGGLKKQSFGIPTKDGKLKMPHDKVYGLEHLAIKILGRGATERKVVYLIHAFQILFILIGFLML